MLQAKNIIHKGDEGHEHATSPRIKHTTFLEFGINYNHHR